MATTLKELLGGLCKTSDDEAILDELAAAVSDFDADGQIVFFESGMEFEFDPPDQDYPKHPDVPPSFQAITKVFGAMWWDAGGPDAGWALAEDGASDADDWLFAELKDEYPDEFGRIEAAGKVVPSFMAGQNGLFFDPTRKLSNGEPALAFISHEGGGWEPVESVNHLDYGQILLRMISDAMIETQHIPEIYF